MAKDSDHTHRSHTKTFALKNSKARHLEVDGDGEGLALLGSGHVAAMLARHMLLELLLTGEHNELLLQARLVLAQVVHMPEVLCRPTMHVAFLNRD